jgi:hypothetical protein
VKNVTVTVTATWRSTTEVEVPDDYEFNGSIDEVWAEQIDSASAELVDWDVEGA